VSEDVGQNRYAAPAAALELPQPALRVRKPIVVWITQIISSYYVVTTMVEIIRRLLRFRSKLHDDLFVWGILLGVGLLLVIIGLLIVIVVQLQRRSSVGRWLAVALIAFMIISGAMALPSLPAGGLEAKDWGFMSGAIGVFALLGWWLYLIGFSRKARAWFTKTAHPADPSAPR
jgi:hypothetical protein